MNLDFITLSNKVLTGEATEEEILRLNQLINSDENLLFEHNRIKERLLQVNKLRQIFDLNIEKDWNFVSTKIKQKERFNKWKGETSYSKLSVIDLFIRIAAIIIIISGLSFWLFKVTTSTIDSGRFMVIRVPFGAKNTVELIDGTVVDLNSGSVLKVPVDFNKTNRTVDLEGEAYFDVTKSDLPFIVKTSTIDIKVHGTKFNIKAYNDEKFVETTLIEGSLSVKRKDLITKKTKKNSRTLKLVPNQKLVFDKKTNNMVLLSYKKAEDSEQEKEELINPKIDVEKLEKNNVIPIVQISDEREIESSVAWKKGLIFLNHESLEELAIKLERMYNLKVEFENEEIKKFTVSGTLRKFTIDQLMDGLKLMLPINYQIKEDKVIIYMKK